MTDYSVNDYGRMIRDRVRTDAYARALEHVVQPDALVLDIGSGTGILALLAAQCGARQVFAVEPENMIELARELAKANALADRITFIRGMSTEIELPEPVDVIVSDLHGVLPLFQVLIPSIVDARSRLLAEGGAQIPFKETLLAAPIELPGVYEERITSWEASAYGLDLAGARPFAANSWRRVSATPDELVADPATLAVLDYRSISSPNVSSSTEFEVKRPGTIHGVVVWFDSDLAEGVSFSNAPGEPEMIYGQAFLPLLEAVDVSAGDLVSFDFSASLVAGEYLFRWDTRVADASSPNQDRAAFTQSTLFAEPLAPETLVGLRDGHVPTTTDDGDAAAFVLERVDGRRTLGDLSRDLGQRFPERFRSPDDALQFVVRTSQRYCR